MSMSVAPTSELCLAVSTNQIESLGSGVLLGHTLWASCYLVSLRVGLKLLRLLVSLYVYVDVLRR